MTEPYTCPKCHESFEALFAYWRHMRDRHPESRKKTAMEG
jgi:hypothetical protein